MARTSVHGSFVVEVMSDQELMSETVSAALGGRGLHVVRRSWSAAGPGHRGIGGPRSVGVLISALDGPLPLAAAATIVSRRTGHWVVVTDSPVAASWGAVLSAGAAGVLPATVTLERIEEALGRIHRGLPVTDAVLARRVEARWAQLEPAHGAALARLARLTPRERRVLKGLHAGEPVSLVAERLGISQATVRSQVKSLLHKLEVGGQVAAVVLVESLATSGIFDPEPVDSR